MKCIKIFFKLKPSPRVEPERIVHRDAPPQLQQAAYAPPVILPPLKIRNSYKTTESINSSMLKYRY